MIKKILLFILVFFAVSFHAQQLRFSGNTKDTVSKSSLPNALMMAIRFTDSTLVNFSRSDKDGNFKSFTVPLDTYIVILSHPSFNDRTYFLVPDKNDTIYDFKNVILPPKSVVLNEVEVVAFKDKMYYKGDTLVFTADSFKVRPNASVEDLLRKLPGVKVDAAGKITIQGKAVDQVLVDGDEFFGTDPTVATRNLNATTVDQVQVFEKKKESTEGEGNSDEMVKILNLKLKEDAKKGYFGKVTGATDFQKFYENDVLLNKFKKDRKISLYGLYTNTPKQAFDWSDAYKYGINDNGNTNYDPETNSWTSFGDSKSGIPQTLKSGFYFNDKLSKNTKVNSDYSFKQNQLNTSSEVNTQYFLEDTTYSNKQISSQRTFNQNHNFNFKITTKLDSLTELVVRPKGSYFISNTNNEQKDDFISQNDTLQRQTTVSNIGKSDNLDANLLVKLTRNFMKKDRVLSFVYNPTYYDNKSENELNTSFLYFRGQLPDSSLKQKRLQLTHRQEQSASVTFSEPFTKKWKGEVSYGFSHFFNTNTRATNDFEGSSYDKLNVSQSNDFRNMRISHRGGASIRYEVKKYRYSLGANFKNIYQENNDITKSTQLKRDFNSIMPYASANIRFSSNSSLWANYNTNFNPPDLNKMQPVIDNSDPNRITTGNPDLKPAFTNNINLNYYFYKSISDVNFNMGLYGSQTANEINDKTSYDSLGRAVTIPVNISGSYNSNLWLNGAFPILHKWMKIEYNLSSSTSKNLGYVNDVLNTTETYGVYPGLTFQKQNEWLEISVGGNYNYDITHQTISINSNQNYYTYSYNSNLMIRFPKKFILTGEYKYTNNGNRTPGYNIDIHTVNASLSKAFLKRDALTVVLEGFDLLNQNINNTRTVETNRIVDRKTQIIKRYFLFRLIWKFTSQKAEKEEDEDD
jgi:hypothetical protein